MRFPGRKWLKTVVAAELSGAAWLVAASDGYGLELLWLPAVAIGAAWPREATKPRCRPRSRRSAANETE
jgi:hypothetical protein